MSLPALLDAIDANQHQDKHNAYYLKCRGQAMYIRWQN